jgi:CBS domain-containing protein
MIMIDQASVASSEIINRRLTQIDREVSVLDASKLMKKSGATELLVTGETEGQLLPLGIVTANDIVTRVIAAELDPAVLTTGDITWSGIAAKIASDCNGNNLMLSADDCEETLAVVDCDGRLVGTMRRDELVGAARNHWPQP